MKKFISCLLVATLFITACNNNKAKESVTVTSKDGTEKATFDPTALQEAAQDLQKKKDELTGMTPLTEDQLKALIPEQLMGANRSDIDVSASSGANIVDADYKINDSTDIKLTVIDCAGPGGAGIYNMQFLGMYNVQEDNEDEYTKTIDFNGGKAFENCKKKRAECTLTYFSGGRFMVTLDGDNVGIDALKTAAKGLKLN